MVKPLSQTLTWTYADCVRPIEIEPGIMVAILWRDEQDRWAAIVTFEMEATWCPHGSEAAEVDLYVLCGAVSDGKRTLPAGTFVHWPEQHDATLSSATGAQLLVLSTGTGAGELHKSLSAGVSVLANRPPPPASAGIYEQ